jgi:hypothetical protein
MKHWFAPLLRGEASGFCERGIRVSEKPTPRSPSAHDPLVRGSASITSTSRQVIQ